MTMKAALTSHYALLFVLHASPPPVQSFSSVKFASIRFAQHHFTTRHYHSSVVWRHCNNYNHHQRSVALMSTSTSSTATESKILGGDYAGLSATFSSKTGELVPVPEHLVPESMIEWGEIPSSFETLTSEDWVANGNDDSAEEFGRTTITVLPEVGCGIDNLEVMKKSEQFGNDVSRLVSWQQGLEQEVAAIDRISSQTLDMETIFQVSSDTSEEGNEQITRRIRLSLSIDMPKQAGAEPTLSKLMLKVERQSSSESTQGTAWSGPSYNSGGLDARSVMNAIGKDIVYGDVFAVKKIKVGGDIWDLDADGGAKDDVLDVLEGSWRKTMISPESDGAIDVGRAKGDFGGDSGASLRLPQNILVTYDSSSIEISHLVTIVGDGKMRFNRRVISRSIGANGLGDISYWLEEKVS